MTSPVAGFDDTDDVRVSVFLRSVGAGERDVVAAMLASAPALVNAVGPHPFWGGHPQPLHVAVETGRRDVFQLLLEAGADVNGINDRYDHWSPLMIAIVRCHDDLRDALLGSGAQVQLAEALLLADDERVAALLDQAPPPPAVPGGGSFVALARTPFAIDRLMSAGASATAPDRWGTTPLLAFCGLGSPGRVLVQRLADHGVHAGPVEWARLGDLDAVARLAAADPAIARREDVVMAAVTGAHHALVSWLLDRGAPVNARAHDRSHQTVLHEAAWLGDLPMVELLVARGADPRALDDEHRAMPRDWAETAITVSNNPRCAAVVGYLDRLTA